MSVSANSKKRVESALDWLAKEYPIKRRYSETWTVSASEYNRTKRRFQLGTVGGAGAWIRNDQGKVLLVQETVDGAWSEPSGKQEPGETLPETAKREVKEETNVACTLKNIELAQIIETRRRPPKETLPIHRLILIFGAEYDSGDPQPASDEIVSVRWFAIRPPNLRYDALADLPINPS